MPELALHPKANPSAPPGYHPGQGNWVYAGFDLTMLALGALLALVAWHAAPAPGKLGKTRKRSASEPLMAPAEVAQA